MKIPGVLGRTLFCLLMATFSFQTHAAKDEMGHEGPCIDSISQLKEAYATNSEFRTLTLKALGNMQHLPSEYPGDNPWLGKEFSDIVQFFSDWCTFLPTVDGSHDDGLKYIQHFAWFYYKNAYGVQLVQTSPGKEIFKNFARQRGNFMDSKASAAHIAEWLKEPRIEKQDYNLPDPGKPDGGFKSFNEFFARTLKNQDLSRPQTMPKRDYVISAPTDCIMNSVAQEITDAKTLIPTKLHQALNIVDMLDGSAYAAKFIGGTALSCVLMPNTYHHYHSPVSGKVVESKIINDAYYGYDDFPVWAPASGNVGYYGTQFSQFDNFKRGYFIVDTGKYGHVAFIPVGLNTISSIVFDKKFNMITEPVPVKRGEELGHFLYGGSLFIMVFEPGRYKSGAIQVRLGNQIGTFGTGKAGE